MMSPGKASSTTSRSCAKKRIGLCTAIALPVGTQTVHQQMRVMRCLALRRIGQSGQHAADTCRCGQGVPLAIGFTYQSHFASAAAHITFGARLSTSFTLLTAGQTVWPGHVSIAQCASSRSVRHHQRLPHQNRQNRRIRLCFDSALPA